MCECARFCELRWGAEASAYSRDGCGLHTALAVRVNERRVAPAPFGAPSGCPRTGAGPPAARPPGRGLDAWRRACPRPLCQKSGVYSMIIFTMSYAHWKRSSALETRIAKPADVRAPRLPLFALSYTHCRVHGMAAQRGVCGGAMASGSLPLYEMRRTWALVDLLTSLSKRRANHHPPPTAELIRRKFDALSLPALDSLSIVVDHTIAEQGRRLSRQTGIGRSLRLSRAGPSSPGAFFFHRYSGLAAPGWPTT